MLPIATDGAFFPDGQHFVVRNYAVAAVYAFPSLEKVDQFQLPDQQQGEGHRGRRRRQPAAQLGGAALRRAAGAAADDPRRASATPSPSAVPVQPHTESREDTELPETTETQRPAWPWFLGGLIGLGCIVVLTRSLRRR